MHTGQRQFSVFERFAVVAILFAVFAMLMVNLLHSVKVSEQRSVKKAVVEYAGLKSMYAEQRQVVPRN